MVKTKQSFPLNLIISKLFLLSNLIIDRNFSMIICHEDILLSKIVVIIYFVHDDGYMVIKLVKKYIKIFIMLNLIKHQ